VFDWLYEGRQAVYLVLACLAVLFVALWTRNRKRRWLYLAAVPLVLIGVYFLLDRLVETRREQIGRKLNEMAAAVRARDVGRILDHTSERFRWEQGSSPDKATFRRKVEEAVRTGLVSEVVVWAIEPNAEPGRVTFMAKPKGASVPDHPGFPCEAEFVQDLDGQWRMARLAVFKGGPGPRELLDIPQLRTGP